jgi:hypothetical protein
VGSPDVDAGPYDARMGERIQCRVDFDFRLFREDTGPTGTLPKTWYFDLPVERDRPADWTELLSRLFYDANVRLSRQEPQESGYFEFTRYAVSPVDLGLLLAWDGDRSSAAVAGHMPWLLAAHKVVWEFTACHFVDDFGAYDGMEFEDFTELVLYRAMDSGVIRLDVARAFLDRFYPGRASLVLADRDRRYANLVGIRPAQGFRRRPGEQPWRCGPLLSRDLPPPPGAARQSLAPR